MSVAQYRGIIKDIESTAIENTHFQCNLVNVHLVGVDGKPFTMPFKVGCLFALHYQEWERLFGIPSNQHIAGQVILNFDSEARARNGNWRLVSISVSETYRNYEVEFRPAVGDEVVFTWDYHNFNGEILKLGENRVPFEGEIPVVGKQTINYPIMFDSATGKGEED